MSADLSSPSTPVLPIGALAYDGDAAYVVERAAEPPTTAQRRFRQESAPIAARVAEQVRAARDLLAGAALDAGARAAVGRGLQAVVVELRELAESYDQAPVADVCRAREAGAATLDPRAVAGIEHVAHGLLQAVADAPTAPSPDDPPPPADAPTAEASPADAPQRDDSPRGDAPVETPVEDAAAAPAVAPEPFRPPTGPALVALLEHGITGLEGFPGTPLDMPAVPAAAPVAAAEDGVVAIASLVYRGRAALTRAREVRDLLRAQNGAPDPELLAELYDLVDLAAAD